jgi:hypothetical protein
MQRPWKRGRIAAAAAGLGFVGVLVLAAVFRAEIQTWYHLERLKRDPGYFLRIAGEAEGSPERAACDLYVTWQEGKQALLRALAGNLREILQVSGGWRLVRDSSFTVNLSCSAAVLTGWEPFTFDFPPRMLGMDFHEIYGKGPGLRSFKAIVGWLPALGPAEHAIPEDPGTTYEVSRGEEGWIVIRVRKLTPPIVPPASTPPSPPSTGTSAG